MLITHGIDKMVTVGEKVNITDTTGINWQFNTSSILRVDVTDSDHLHELVIEFRGTLCDHRFLRTWLT